MFLLNRLLKTVLLCLVISSCEQNEVSKPKPEPGPVNAIVKVGNSVYKHGEQTELKIKLSNQGGRRVEIKNISIKEKCISGWAEGKVIFNGDVSASNDFVAGESTEIIYEKTNQVKNTGSTDLEFKLTADVNSSGGTDESQTIYRVKKKKAKKSFKTTKIYLDKDRTIVTKWSYNEESPEYSGNKSRLFVTNCLNKQEIVLLNTSANLPDEIESIKLVFPELDEPSFVEDGTTYKWELHKINKPWNENTVDKGIVYKSDFKHKIESEIQGDTLTFDLPVSKKIKNNRSFQNGYYLLPEYNEKYSDWNGYWMKSSESNQDNRPYFLIKYEE